MELYTKKLQKQTLDKRLVKTNIFKRYSNISIKQKLPFFIMAIVIITVLVTVGTTLLFFLNYTNTVAQTNVIKGMDALQESLDNYKNKAFDYASIFATHPNVINAVSTRNTAAVLSSLSNLVKKSHIDFVTVTDSNGIVIARTHEPSHNGDSVINQLNVRMALQGTPFAAIEQGTAVKLSARAGVPVRNEAGYVIGVISAGFKLDKTNIVDDIKKTFNTDATIFLKDVRITSTIKEKGRRIVGTHLDPIIAKIVLTKNRKYIGKAVILGQPYITVYKPLLGPDNRSIGVIFTGESIKEVLKTTNNVLISISIITLILLMLVYWIVSTILNVSLINPLKIAVDVLKQVAAGNLNIQIPEAQISEDEIGQMLSSLKVMVGNVRELVHEIHELGETVAAAAQEMMASSEEVTKAGEHVVGAITDLAKEASEQASLTEKGNTAIKQIVSGLNQITADMVDSESLATKAWENVNNGHKAVQIQESKMEDNKKITNKVNISIYNLNQMSSEIEEILSVIKGVAEQTNLLAINAAIEAARAKEQGRGFAVVAQQVKSLSEQSGNSVEKISTIIHTLQSNIGQIVEEMNQVESAADEEEKSLTHLISIFRNVSDSVNVISDRIKSVSKAVNGLSVNANHAGNSMEEIAGIAEETAAGSEEVSASSEEQTAYMQQIATSAEDLAKIASLLLNKIHQFNM
jgi:methyl-accepting chemotaxis protein